MVKSFSARCASEITRAPRSPWQNPYVERLIGSLRREWLDRVVVFGERHPRSLLSCDVEYYNQARTHLSLGKNSPIAGPVEIVGRIVRSLFSAISTIATRESEFAVGTRHSMTSTRCSASTALVYQELVRRRDGAIGRCASAKGTSVIITAAASGGGSSLPGATTAARASIARSRSSGHLNCRSGRAPGRIRAPPARARTGSSRTDAWGSLVNSDEDVRRLDDDNRAAAHL